jgi:Ca2+-binding EF-hand superfamily protein
MTSTETKFMQIIIYFYALKWIISEDIEEERATFFALDTDNDGRLSMADLVSALQGRYTKAQIEEAMISRHHHSKKYVSFLEFLTYVLDKQILLANMELVKTVFEFFDKDHEGSIEGSELKDQLDTEDIDDCIWDEMIFEAVGKNECTLEDFVELIKNL